MVHWGSVCCDPPVPKSNEDGLWRQCLVEASLVVCLSKVTEANIEEWLFRLRLAQKLLDPEMFKLLLPSRSKKSKWREKDIDAGVLRRWVGLWTNAKSMERMEWINAVAHKVVERVERQVRDELKEGE
jgi:hypothetical protein